MKIGIIRTSSIGDVILASASLEFIERVAPDAEIIWIGRKPSLELIRAGRDRLRAIEFPSRAGLGTTREILRELSSCAVVIDLQTSSKTLYLRWRLRALGVPVVVARKQTLRRGALVWRAWARQRFFKSPDSVTRPTTRQYQMMLQATADALKKIGVRVETGDAEAVPRIFASDAKVSGLDPWTQELQFGTWIAVAPGASHETKRAPTEIFQAALRSLANLASDQIPGIVFVGGPEDRAAARDLIDKLNWPAPVLNLAGKLSLSQTAAVFLRTHALLSNDSGLGHLCEAVGKPVAVLFGPTAEGFGFPPRRGDSKAFSSAIGCRPCSKHGKAPCRYKDLLCFRGIDTRAVAAHLAHLLKSGEPT